MFKVKKVFFIVLGFIFLAIGGVGTVIPILPTTPFLLLAAACFGRGSKRFEMWFLNTKIYKKHLESFVKERSMLLETKIKICIVATIMLMMAFFMMDNIYGKIVVLALIGIKYYYFIFVFGTVEISSVKEMRKDSERDVNRNP